MPACQHQSDCYDLPRQAHGSQLTLSTVALLGHLAPRPQLCQAGKAAGRIRIEVIDSQYCDPAVNPPEEQPGLRAICVLGNCVGDPLRRDIAIKSETTASAPATADHAKLADPRDAIGLSIAYHGMLQEPADY